MKMLKFVVLLPLLFLVGCDESPTVNVTQTQTTARPEARRRVPVYVTEQPLRYAEPVYVSPRPPVVYVEPPRPAFSLRIDTHGGGHDHRHRAPPPHRHHK